MPDPSPPPDFIAAFRDLARAEVERDRASAPALACNDRRAFRMKFRRLDNGAIYGDVFAPWQEEHLFAPMDAGMSLFNEAPRGHDRTDGEGWQICTDLQYGPPNQKIIIVASDKRQAALPLERCERYNRDFPWLFPNITVQSDTIWGPNGSKCIVLAADTAGSLGEKPSMVYVEELGVWAPKGEALWTSIIGACAKLNAPIRVLTNATIGKTGNWRWTAREGMRQLAEKYPDRYHFWSAPGWVADWSRAKIDELRLLFPSPRDQARFIDNVTHEGNEFPAFDRADIEAAIGAATGPPPPTYQTADNRILTVAGEEKPSRITAWVAGADYGLTGDAMCAASIALTSDGRAWLFDDFAIAGKPGSPALIAAVEQHLADVARRRPLIATVFDPTEAQNTIQAMGGELQAEGDRWGPGLKVRIYKALLTKMRGRHFRAPANAFERRHANGQTYDLRREMVEATERSTPSGTYLVHPEGGHDDGLAVVQMCLHRLSECSLEPAFVSVPEDRPERGWRPHRDRALAGRRR